uniref:Superfamily Cerm-07 n=1 Tax=Conus magus TaxID=6492 RepID=A0A5P8I0R8_CONMA|nr:superfamily Cerm-07 [Conus magus]
MRLSTMHSVILMVLLMFAFDNVDGDEPGQTARDVDNRKFMSSLRSVGKPAAFFMARERRTTCGGKSCPAECRSPCYCKADNSCWKWDYPGK